MTTDKKEIREQILWWFRHNDNVTVKPTELAVAVDCLDNYNTLNESFRNVIQEMIGQDELEFTSDWQIKLKSVV